MKFIHGVRVYFVPGPVLAVRIDDENVIKIVPGSEVPHSQGENTQDVSLRVGTQYPPTPPPQK